MSGAHPNIYESVSVFQEEENEASLRYYSALEGNPPPNSRRRKRIIDNQLLANYKNMLKNDEISLNTYVKYISTNFNFEKPKKSKKAEVSSSEDECESDDSGPDSDDWLHNDWMMWFYLLIIINYSFFCDLICIDNWRDMIFLMRDKSIIYVWQK